MNNINRLSKVEDSIYVTEPYGLIDEEGSCNHHWIFVGRNEHGEYYRCSHCGLEEEV